MKAYQKTVRSSSPKRYDATVIMDENGTELFRTESERTERASDAADKAVADWFKFNPRYTEDEYLTWLNTQ